LRRDQDDKISDSFGDNGHRRKNHIIDDLKESEEGELEIEEEQKKN
jgi:hypothetical protein